MFGIHCVCGGACLGQVGDQSNSFFLLFESAVTFVPVGVRGGDGSSRGFSPDDDGDDLSVVAISSPLDCLLAP